MTSKGLMPIGQFSKCCRLSIKALRHYDEEGVLRPACVDAETGYRYYARTQAREAVLIAMLRSLDVPLASVGPLLRAQGPELRSLLAEQRRRLVRELDHKQQALRSLERLAHEGELLPYPIALRVEPAHLTASASCSTMVERMLYDSSKLVDTLLVGVREAGQGIRDPFMCINEDPKPDGTVVVHACVGVAAPFAALKQSRFVEVPGGTVAWLIHRGAYEELGIAYHALSAWAQEHGHEQGAPLREIYLNDPAEVTTEELETEVLFPIGEWAGSVLRPRPELHGHGCG